MSVKDRLLWLYLNQTTSACPPRWRDYCHCTWTRRPTLLPPGGDTTVTVPEPDDQCFSHQVETLLWLYLNQTTSTSPTRWRHYCDCTWTRRPVLLPPDGDTTVTVPEPDDQCLSPQVERLLSLYLNQTTNASPTRWRHYCDCTWTRQPALLPPGGDTTVTVPEPDDQHFSHQVETLLWLYLNQTTSASPTRWRHYCDCTWTRWSALLPPSGDTTVTVSERDDQRFSHQVETLLWLYLNLTTSACPPRWRDHCHCTWTRRPTLLPPGGDTTVTVPEPDDQCFSHQVETLLWLYLNQTTSACPPRWRDYCHCTWTRRPTLLPPDGDTTVTVAEPDDQCFSHQVETLLWLYLNQTTSASPTRWRHYCDCTWTRRPVLLPPGGDTTVTVPEPDDQCLSPQVERLLSLYLNQTTNASPTRWRHYCDCTWTRRPALLPPGGDTTVTVPEPDDQRFSHQVETLLWLYLNQMISAPPTKWRHYCDCIWTRWPALLPPGGDTTVTVPEPDNQRLSPQVERLLSLYLNLTTSTSPTRWRHYCNCTWTRRPALLPPGRARTPGFSSSTHTSCPVTSPTSANNLEVNVKWRCKCGTIKPGLWGHFKDSFILERQPKRK